MQIGMARQGIYRQAAIEAIEKIFPVDPMKNEYTQGVTCGAALAKEYIKQLPSAQPDVPDTNVGDMISRQAAIDALEWKWAGKAAFDAIKNLPSAQPEIIRCKDCEWFRKECGWNCIEYTVCGISPTHHPIRREEDFCSKAERREE